MKTQGEDTVDNVILSRGYESREKTEMTREIPSR
jgi:hypothetical protein